MSEQPDTCPGPCNLDAMREDGWKRCAHSIPIPPVPDHAQSGCEHDWKQYRDGKPPKCAKCGERKQTYADIEAERDELRVLLKTLTDSVANGRIAHIGSIRAHTAQVNMQLVERCKEALR